MEGNAKIKQECKQNWTKRHEMIIKGKWKENEKEMKGKEKKMKGNERKLKGKWKEMKGKLKEMKGFFFEKIIVARGARRKFFWPKFKQGFKVA